MPRSHHSSGGGTSASSLMAINVIAAKEPEYREGVTSNHAMSSILAETIAHSGELESIMLEAVADNEDLKQEVQEFLKEQRERLKKVSEKNVTANRNIDVFLASLQEMREHIQHTSADEDNVDYEKLLDDTMKKNASARKSMDLDIGDEDMCRELRSKLNEKEPRKKKAKTGNRKKGGESDDEDEDDDDDDLEVVNIPTTSEQSLKCPITGMLFEEPVKHKTCKHTYSLAGLKQLLSTGNRRCPVPGCRTSGIAMEQVEKDEQMEMKVRKHKRRKDRERQQRLTSQVDSDEEVL